MHTKEQNKAQVLVDALSYIQKFAGDTVVIKYGGSAMFDEMIQGIKTETVKLLYHVRAERPVEREKVAEETGASHGNDESVKNAPVKNENRVGRNDMCPCGSGKKYKNCCGREA